MGINGGQTLEMSNVTNGTSVDGEHTMTSRVTRTVTTTVTSGSSQEDYRMLADGTWVDSHGQVVGKNFKLTSNQTIRLYLL